MHKLVFEQMNFEQLIISPNDTLPKIANNHFVEVMVKTTYGLKALKTQLTLPNLTPYHPQSVL
jgi:hypothetical protein